MFFVSSAAKYEHETVIVENEYPHSAINLVSNASHRIFHGNETDRHSDEYVTPIGSPRLQQQQPQQPSTPQKSSTTTNNSMTQTTPTVSGIPLPTAVPMPAVSPNSAQQNQVSSHVWCILDVCCLISPINLLSHIFEITGETSKHRSI